MAISSIIKKRLPMPGAAAPRFMPMPAAPRLPAPMPVAPMPGAPAAGPLAAAAALNKKAPLFRSAMVRGKMMFTR